MVAGSGVELAVTVAVGDGGTNVVVRVIVGVPVAMVGIGTTVSCKVGKTLQAVVPARHRTMNDQNFILMFFCLMGKAGHLHKKRGLFQENIRFILRDLCVLCGELPVEVSSTLIPADVGFDHLAAHLIFKLLGRRLHKIR
jgi:hypothetical protein